VTLLVLAVLVGVVIGAVVVGQKPAAPTTIAPLSEAVRAEALALREGGRAIEAIKLVRRQTGLGLREAKEAVERL
jgi:ribosomal protein L7/L12